MRRAAMGSVGAGGELSEAAAHVLYSPAIMPLVFQHLGGLPERHRMIPLVCHSWLELLHSPHLLRSLNISLDCSRPGVLSAFCAWLATRAAGQVQRLELELRAEGIAPALKGDAEVHTLFAVLQACGAGGCLRELRLRADSQLTVSPDALGPLCACLERLSLRAHSRSHESASTAIYAFGLEALTALKELELVGSAVELHRCHLPPRLTQLHLQGFRDLTSSMRHSLPRQLEGLSQLRALHLVGIYANTPDCYRPLLSLPVIETLALTKCAHLPACLPQLSSLRALCLEKAPISDDRQASAELGAALAGLSQLTCLAIRGMELGGCLPPALSELGQLRSLYLVRDGNEIAKYNGPQLPVHGPYLDSLEQLTLEPHVADSNLPALSEATRLQCLMLCGQLRSGLAHLAVAAWADNHASLHQLAVLEWPVPERTRQRRMDTHWLQLGDRLERQQLRASLAVTYTAATYDDMCTNQPLLALADIPPC